MNDEKERIIKNRMNVVGKQATLGGKDIDLLEFKNLEEKRKIYSKANKTKRRML